MARTCSALPEVESEHVRIDTCATLMGQVFGFLWRIIQTSSGCSLPSPFCAAFLHRFDRVRRASECFTTSKIGHLRFFVSSSSDRTCDLMPCLFLPTLLYTCSVDSISSMSAAFHLSYAGSINISFPVPGIASRTLVACGCSYTRPRCRCASSWYRHTGPPFGERRDEGGIGNSVPPTVSLVVRLERSTARCFGSRLRPVLSLSVGDSQRSLAAIIDFED